MQLAIWGHPYSEFPVGKDSPDDFRRQFARLREAGIGTYIPFVMTHGEHFFESEILGAPSRDLLGPCLDAASAEGVEVHPITGLGSVGIVKLAEDDDSAGMYDPGPDAADLPSWARDWPCPAWPENRRLTCAVAAGMVATYHPDGLSLDYLRYPNTGVLNSHPCQCERCQAEREVWLGKPIPDADDLSLPGVAYAEVRMRNRFVKTLVYGLKEVADEADVPLSLAARARYLKDALPEGQDWLEWCQEDLLDFVCPMSYNDCFARFQRFVREHRAMLQDTGVPLYCGVGRSSSLGTISPAEMVEQIRFAAHEGADGACIFHMAALGDEDYQLLAELSAELE